MNRRADRLNPYQKINEMATTIEGIKFYTVKEVAEALGVTAQTVRSYIREGKLQGKRIGRPILITENALKDFLEA